MWAIGPRPRPRSQHRLRCSAASVWEAASATAASRSAVPRGSGARARATARAALKVQPVLAKQFVKIRFNNFESTTLESLLPASTTTLPSANSFALLMEQAWQRGHRPVRLLGVGVRLKAREDAQQLGLF